MTGYTTGHANGHANELTSDGTWTFTYDGEGNNISKRNISTHEVWTYGYDNDNRLLTAKDVSGTGTTLSLATYTYDVFGNLLEEDIWTQSGGTTVGRFGYDSDQVWVDLNGSNQLQTRYLRGDQEDQLVARISSAGAVAWYLTDWEGSVRNLTDNTGTMQDTITYDGFGNITSESNASFGGAYKFDGMRVDAETGNLITQYREEDLPDGRWMQQDPPGLAAGNNPYCFVSDDPVQEVDPSGLIGIFFDGAGYHPTDDTIIQGFQFNYAAGEVTVAGYREPVYLTTDVGNLETKVKGAYGKVVGELKLHPCEPVDIIGYSRGGIAAIALAQMLNHHKDDHGKAAPITVRFLGLVDPTAPVKGYTEDKSFLDPNLRKLGDNIQFAALIKRDQKHDGPLGVNDVFTTFFSVGNITFSPKTKVLVNTTLPLGHFQIGFSKKAAELLWNAARRAGVHLPDFMKSAFARADWSEKSIIHLEPFIKAFKKFKLKRVFENPEGP